MDKKTIIKIIDKTLVEIAYLNSCVTMYKNIYDYSIKKEYKKIYKDVSPTFFTFTSDIYKYRILMGLIRLYDTNYDTYSLSEIINECEKNKSLFPTERKIEFINEFNEPDEIIYNYDIENVINEARNKISRCSEQIENLRKLRNKSYVHNDKKYYNNQIKLFEQYNFTWGDGDKLLKTAHEICNSILSILDHRTTYQEYIDSDDLKKLLAKAKVGELYWSQYIEDYLKKGKEY